MIKLGDYFFFQYFSKDSYAACPILKQSLGDNSNRYPQHMSLWKHKGLKLMTSLVNVSLKFKMLILQIHCYFLLEKCENFLQCKTFSHFSNKNNSVFDNVVGIYLTR